MKKIILLSILLVAAIAILSTIWWCTGKLFWRVSNATITTNGVTSDESRIYKSRTGEYFIFTKDRENKPSTYVVFDKDQTVGIPSRAVPSSQSKSVKTTFFLLCLECPITLAGTDKYDRNAKVSVSSSEISFKIYENTVVVKF